MTRLPSSSSSSSYQDRNNTGVVLLLEQRYNEAAACFLEAVKYVNERSEYYSEYQTLSAQHQLQPQQPQHNSLYEYQHSNTNMARCPFRLLYCVLSKDAEDKHITTTAPTPGTIGPQDQAEEDISLSSNETTFMFRNPIVVSERRSSSSSSNRNSSSRNTLPPPSSHHTNSAFEFHKEACAQLSSATVYNIALTYHLAAMNPDLKGKNSTTTANLLSSSSTQGNDDVREDPQQQQERSMKRQRTNSNSVSSSRNTVSTRRRPDTHDQHRTKMLLRHALRYYEVSYTILIHEEDVLLSHAMVLLNNMGHVYRLLEDELSATIQFRRLLSLMLYIQQTAGLSSSPFTTTTATSSSSSTSTPASSSSLRQQIGEWDRFLDNVLEYMIEDTTNSVAGVTSTTSSSRRRPQRPASAATAA